MKLYTEIDEELLYSTYQNRLLRALIKYQSEIPVICPPKSHQSQYRPQDIPNGQQHTKRRYGFISANIKPQAITQVMRSCHGPNTHHQNHSSRHMREQRTTRKSHRIRNSRRHKKH